MFEEEKVVVVSSSVNSAQSSSTTPPIVYPSSSSSNTLQTTTNNFNTHAGFPTPQIQVNPTLNTTTQQQPHTNAPISTTVVQPPPLVFTHSPLPTIINKPAVIQPPPPNLTIPNSSLKRKVEEIVPIKTEDSKKTTTLINAPLPIQPKPVQSEKYRALHPDYITPFVSKEDAYERLIVFQSLTNLNPPEPSTDIIKGTAEIVSKLEALEKIVKDLNKRTTQLSYKEDLLQLEKLAQMDEKAENEILNPKNKPPNTLPILTNTTTLTPNINLLQVRMQPPLSTTQIPRTIGPPISTMTPLIRAPTPSLITPTSNLIISPNFAITPNTNINTNSNISLSNGALGNASHPVQKNINAPLNSNTVNNAPLIVNNSSTTTKAEK
eukprot:TRINITY_DN1719_c0_g2_i2.p1 TRINITY_DN1719_c0_g2~~TRINITY_DN1719_c0_g2_i2.p1  ORF type:complete len:394 (-),score=94.92 TRINITY_DN1719_c0_g2_i2:54-1190(-)